MMMMFRMNGGCELTLTCVWGGVLLLLGGDEFAWVFSLGLFEAGVAATRGRDFPEVVLMSVGLECCCFPLVMVSRASAIFSAVR